MPKGLCDNSEFSVALVTVLVQRLGGKVSVSEEDFKNMEGTEDVLSEVYNSETKTVTYEIKKASDELLTS